MLPEWFAAGTYDARSGRTIAALRHKRKLGPRRLQVMPRNSRLRER
jgi:hypothetical protein